MNKTVRMSIDCKLNTRLAQFKIEIFIKTGSVYGLSSGRHQLLKNLDFRCLMMVVPGIHAEREIQKKRQVICECSRGHVIQIRIRSTSQDLDQDRRVVCFYCDHNRFKEVLDKVQVCYKDFFMYVFEKPENIEVCISFIWSENHWSKTMLECHSNLNCDEAFPMLWLNG